MQSIAKDHFDKKAKQSEKNRTEGRKNVTIDLKKTVEVRFTKDFGFLKAGHTQKVSETAYEIYSNQGVVEKVN